MAKKISKSKIICEKHGYYTKIGVEKQKNKQHQIANTQNIHDTNHVQLALCDINGITV